MFNAKSNSEYLPTNSAGKKIPVGIHAKCKVTDINIGENFIDFVYADSESRVHNKRVWFPDPTKPPMPKADESVSEAIHRDAQERAAHITAHLKSMANNDEWMSISAPTFRDYAMMAKRYLDTVKDTAYINLKLVLDKDLEWSEFPRYPNYIEKYIDGEAPTLKFSEWELKNRVHKPKDDGTPSAETPGVKYY
jgi:hypothetical protein